MAVVPGELEGRWSLVRGTPVYHRAREVDGAPVVLHLHGFAISGSYMVPTARLLADEFTTYVPDLPGFGRSPRPDYTLDIPELADSAAAFLHAVGAERATVVGNSLCCAVLASFAQRHPDRLERAVMVSPAGGVQSQPLPRALWQLAQDAPREALSMATVAVPDYVSFGVVAAYRLFLAMTRSRRSRPSSLWTSAAHAINYSHPRELSDLIRGFVRGEGLVSTLDPIDGRRAVAVLRRG